MSKPFERDDYYNIIVSIIKSSSVKDYLEDLCRNHYNSNPQLINLLSDEIRKVVDGVKIETERQFYPLLQLEQALNWLHKKAPDKEPGIETDKYLLSEYSPEYKQKFERLQKIFKTAQSITGKPDRKGKEKRRRIPKENKIRAELQKEINSKCPFCNSDDVGHFEIHHIDGNPTNNETINLILVCPTCHSKITKGDIPLKDVKKAKVTPIVWKPNIEFVSATIDSENCSWNVKDDLIFYFQESGRSPFPIIGITLINHTENTIVLKAIAVKTKYLFSGLSGIPQAMLLRSIVKYKVCINDTEEGGNLILTEPLLIPSKQGAKFDMELFEWVFIDEKTYPATRTVLNFRLEFSGNLFLDLPAIYLNTMDENEGITLMRVS